jgi:uncharacterized protein (DUF433 family)
MRAILRREGNGSRSCEGAGELRQNGEVGVKLDALKAAHAEREQRPLVLQAAELALDGGAALVELSPPGRLARDERMKPTRHGGEVLIDAVEHPGHHVAAGTFVDLKQVRNALARGGWVAIEHPREHIQVDPDRLSGQPVVRKRRVSTETVADLAQRAEGLALLREDYGLTEDEIREAVEYERDVSEALAA